MKTEKDLLGCIDKLNKLCRVCLCESNVKSEPLNTYWESIYEKVMSCMQIDFLTKDMLPCEICDLCCKELEVADKLRIKCENSNAVLKRIYQQYLVKDETKLENDLEIYDSDDEPLANNQFSYSESFSDDNKDQIKDVILRVNLEGMALNENKKKKGKKRKIIEKQQFKKCRKEAAVFVVEEIVIKTEEDGNFIDHNAVEYSMVDNKKTFVCDLCRKPLKDKRSLIRHITKQHSAEKMKDLLFKVTGFGSERRFHCSECPHTTKRKIDMKIHSRVHTGHRPYVCDICSRSFTQYGTLAGHKKTHFDTKYYTCQECGKQFKYRETLKSHQRVHSNEFNFVCKLCNKGLKTDKSLSFHMKRHYQIKNHNCELCGATFVTRAELTKHKYSHENKKRFYCTQCDYSSHWRHSLEMHTRRHLKDKTEQCDQCEYTCYTKVELKLHKRKHSKEQNYPCPMCDEKFKQSTSVNKHMLSKHGQKFTWGNVADRRYIK